jgi:hypothetical protein
MNHDWSGTIILVIVVYDINNIIARVNSSGVIKSIFNFNIITLNTEASVAATKLSRFLCGQTPSPLMSTLPSGHTTLQSPRHLLLLALDYHSPDELGKQLK